MGRGGEDEEPREEADVRTDDGEDRERKREGQEQSVVAEVQGDPHDDRDDRTPSQAALEQGGEGSPREGLLPREGRGGDGLAGYRREDARGLVEPPLAGVKERALRDRHPGQEREECGERGGHEEEA